MVNGTRAPAAAPAAAPVEPPKMVNGTRNTEKPHPIDEKAAAYPDFPLKATAIRIFKLADENSSGEIEVVELAKMRGGPNAIAYAESMMKTLDLDANGVISVEEWMKYVQEQCAKEERVKKFSSFTAAKTLAEFEKNLVDPEASRKLGLPLTDWGMPGGGKRCDVFLTVGDDGLAMIDLEILNSSRGGNVLEA